MAEQDIKISITESPNINIVVQESPDIKLIMRNGTVADWNSILNVPSIISDIDDVVDNINGNISSEVLRATSTEQNLSNEIDAEVSRAISAEGDIAEDLNEEILRATGVESTLSSTLSSHISNKSNPHETTKAHIGLGNVANLAPADLGISTATQSALDLKADKTEVSTTIQNIIGTAPEVLNTLGEIADALNDDANFASTMTTSLSNKVDKVSGKGLSTNDLTNSLKTNYDNAFTHTLSTLNPHSVTKSQVGLGNVPNTDCSTTSNISDSVDKRFLTEAERIKLSGLSQYTDSLARGAISETIEGISYDNSTGTFSLTNGYIIPTLANFNNKVDKETGKGLSANDFTNALKAKLDSIQTGGLLYNGGWDASSGAYPSNPQNGNYWIITTAGTINSVDYAIGDQILYNTVGGWSKISISGAQDSEVVHINGDETVYGNKTFDDTLYINDRLNVGSSTFDTTNPEFLKVDGGTSASSNIISGYGNYDSYVQLNIKNKNTGTSSSSDLVATADIGQEGANYIDVGINGSNYADEEYTITKALDGYVLVDGGDLAIGTASSTKKINFFTGGTLLGNQRAVLSDTSFQLSVPIYQTSTSAYETATLGSELLSAGDTWTKNTGWTGDNTSGFVHTTGNTGTLVNTTFTPTVGYIYQVYFTVTGRTTGDFAVSFGGVSPPQNIYSSKAFSPKAISTAQLTITPSSTFNGTILVSIKRISSGSSPISVLKDSSNGTVLEMRSSTSNLYNTFIGVGSGSWNVTGTSNTAVGSTAIQYNTSGQNNTAIGQNALQYNTAGSGNSAVGVNALQNCTSGLYNMAFGMSALGALTSGQANVGIGSGAFSGVTTGYGNVGLGSYVAQGTTTGGYNIAFGLSSFYYNTTGSHNIAMGQGAGSYLADGTTTNTAPSYSIYMGRNTRANSASGTNEIVIGDSVIGNGSNTVTIGNSSNAENYFSGSLFQRAVSTKEMPTLGSNMVSGSGWTVNTGWSGDFASGFTHVNGNTGTVEYPLTTVVGSKYLIIVNISSYTSGSVSFSCGGSQAGSHNSSGVKNLSVQSTNTSGAFIITPSSDFVGTVIVTSIQLISATSVAGYALRDSNGNNVLEIRGGNTTTASGNLFLGNGGAYNSTGTYNVSLGRGALASACTTVYSVAIGHNALTSMTGSGYCTAIGYSALASNITGSGNFALGSQSMQFNTTGNYNVAIGSNALRFGTTMSNCIAMGLSALQDCTASNNIGIGTDALQDSTGNSNTAVGTSAGRYNTSGYYNCYYGHQAGYNNITGNNNVILGYQSGYSSTALSGRTLVGYYAGYSGGGSGSTFVGYQSGYATTGDNNTGFGNLSLANLSTGTNNVAVGYEAGRWISGGTVYNTTSTYSVYLGTASKALASGDTNEIVIGYNAVGAGSDTATLGNTSVTSTILRGSVDIPTLKHSGSSAGFYGTTPISKPTITGSRGGNIALASLLTQLASLGLITNSTTA